MLSSDICLHLQKVQSRKAQCQAELGNMEGSDEELNLLEEEAKRLGERLQKLREIRRLQLELQNTTISNDVIGDQQEPLEYNEEDRDYEDDE